MWDWAELKAISTRYEHFTSELTDCIIHMLIKYTVFT